ncbi:hypothetical protein [Emcibacter nanhaiensis]|uniref:Lipoprotein n=1 Tax=Emcibacter nanhaiensis TaxID=1505037 RepID=A0A501PCE7_9PROT|nr:hypothetical protein [Emcibacter nanhaiensis]TPD57636.1 hypothetical protein FIV46_16140 [Emcibacter nanhaiensis]
MNTRTIFLKLLILSISALFLSACSGDDGLVYDAGPAGPNTEQTLKTLPEGLAPDKENARHSGS